MAWAKCPTHGPVQDASAVYYGEVLDRLACKCGLNCEPYEPEPFVEHEELKTLAKSKRQPREDAASTASKVADAQESPE